MMTLPTPADVQEAERRARARIIETELAGVVAEREAREAEAAAQAEQAAQALKERQEQARLKAVAMVETCKDKQRACLATLDKLATVLIAFEADRVELVKAGNEAMGALRQAFGRNADVEAAQIDLAGHVTLPLPAVDSVKEPGRYLARMVLARIIERGGLR
jgi:hypothetical protein